MDTQIIMRELDPRYDMKRHSRKNHSLYRLYDVALYPVNLAKSIVRGGSAGALAGASVGTLCSLLTGGDISEGFNQGATVGFGIGFKLDAGQYTLRWMAHFLKREVYYTLRIDK